MEQSVGTLSKDSVSTSPPSTEPVMEHRRGKSRGIRESLEMATQAAEKEVLSDYQGMVW